VTDREVAEAAARAGGAVLRERFGGDLRVERKSSRADLVSDADRAAEEAVVAVLRRERPGEGLHGEEGTRFVASRTWVIDGLDGTFNFVSGVPQFCCAVALVDGAGPLACGVHDPMSGELFSAARGEGATCDGVPLRPRGARALDEALVSAQIDARVLTEEALLSIVRAVALVRSGVSGTLDLAWVAAGRIDGWIQHTPEPWDWLPGALLVTEAGGIAAARGDGWHVAGRGAVARGLLELELP
jgi:fructose-1,6-bisphosphatase/inositol monophosphatase family enzyme